MRKTLKKAISVILAATIMLPGAGTVRAAETETQFAENEESFVQSYEEETGTDENEEAFSLNDNLLEPVSSGDASKIHKPRKNTDNGKTVTTWDCIWFGNYWQEDTNGDGHCYSEDYTSGSTTYKADSKQPIKWRVLDIDGSGNALLLADKLIDVVQYNETFTDVTWETCTMRSYLNGYDGSNNVCNKDFSINSDNRSFLYSAFKDSEINCLIKGEVKNPNNPVYGKTGGNTTSDRLFCLSLEEAMNADYGFIKNEFTRPSSGTKYYTDDDPTRVAVTTKFTDDRAGYVGDTAGTSDWWWLRSPGNASGDASGVDYGGAANANGNYRNVDYDSFCARPAFRMNLSSSSSLWTYAGTVSSDGTVDEGIKTIQLPDGGKKDLRFDTSLFASPSNQYNSKLSEIAVCLSAMVYEGKKDENGKEVTEEEEHTRTQNDFSALGFDMSGKHYYEDEHGRESAETIRGDYSPSWIVDKKIQINGEEWDLLMVVVRGTYVMEWIDNFDPGEGEIHAGFERAADYIIGHLNGTKNEDSYIKTHNINTSKTKVLITGHSRGAAVANIIGKKMDDGAVSGITKPNIFVYTFATPNVSRDSSTEPKDPCTIENPEDNYNENYVKEYVYNNIYNLINPEDFVTKVLPAAWGYRRYGINYILPSKTFFSKQYYETLENSIYLKTTGYAPYGKYSKYDSYNKGMHAVTVYVKLITAVVNGVKPYYSRFLNPNYSRFLPSQLLTGSSKTNTEYNLYSLFTLFTKSLAYFMTGQDEQFKVYMIEGANNLLNAKDTWGVLGAATTTYFGYNGAVTPQFGCAHTPETYMAMLEVYREEELTKQRTFLGMTVSCPVNVLIKDSDGNVIGETKNNEIVQSSDELALEVDGESKSFLVPQDSDYKLEFSGYDTGTMDYSICTYDPDIGEISRKVYLKLPVDEETKYTQDLAEVNSGDFSLHEEGNSEAITPETIEYDDLGSLSIKVNVEGSGFADGYESVTPGDYVTLYAYPEETSKFVGWYDMDGNLLSSEESYSISVSQNEEFLAKFTGSTSVSVTGVTLPATGSVKVGKTITLTPDISPSNATDQTVTWKSSAEGVATVSTKGVVTGVKEGPADITVTTNDGGFTATCRVTVTKEGTDPGPDPSEEDLKKDIEVDTVDRDFDMLPGEIRRLPINKTGKYVYGVSYVSSDPKTVSVKNGIVTAKNLKKGETEKKATVTATYNGESVPFVITVKAFLPAITAGQKGNKITAPKTVKADVGTLKTVTATVKLPKALQGKAVKPDKTDYGFFTLEETAPDPKGTKVSFKVTPKEAGAAYVVWTVTDDSGNKSQAYTKVLIKKPLNKLFVSSAETGLDLSVGEGKRLLAATTIGNTDPKNLSFSVKGKGVKVSKSGFVTAITPGATADVTVKAGKYQKTVAVRVKDHTSSILALNKTSVNVKLPKQGAKPKTMALKVTMPKKDPPKVTWSIADSPKGITVDSDGKVTVTSDASPGCYVVTATPEETGNGYNPVSCEVIIK